MLYTIQNEYLTVKISDKGAQLWSIMDNAGNEYLWQGDEKYWGDRAPNLFPYIARLTEGKYILDGKVYSMDIHGFAKDTIFEADQMDKDKIVFLMTNTEETLAQYPYKFTFSVVYKLSGRTLSTTYLVNNQDEKTMYFGIGGHPGFRVPFDNESVFEDYYLEFGTVEKVKRIIFSEDCFVLGEPEPFELENMNILPLRHEMFDEDAIVLTDMSKSVCLKSKRNDKQIRVTCPNMSYLGFWHMPKTDAPYICIEPWSSLPSRKDVMEELSTQPSLLSLEANKIYENEFTIEIIS